jgi:PPM family protein phosphatase
LPTKTVTRLRTASLSDLGSRPRNEDRLLVRELAAAMVLLAVADGMGGEAAGDIAAQLAIDTLAELAPPSGTEEAHLLAQIEAANNRILAEADRRGLPGMGTTLTAALVADDRLIWGHVGDSRLYLFRDGTLRQLTRDQNVAGRMMAAGQFTPAEARVSPYRHLLEQCVGCGRCQPDHGRLLLRTGDLLLLASDGLTGELADEAIAACLGGSTDLERTARDLVAAALAEGGPDNVSVVLAAL